MEYKYNPENYVDYLYTKQAGKEHYISAQERQEILDYYGEMIPDD